MKMASALYHLSSQCSFATLISLLNVCSCFNPKIFNSSKAAFAPSTVATFYGPSDGAGSDGGACGYQGAVETAPFNKFVSAGGPSLFKNGKGCGECYQVKCNSNSACSGRPVTVTITDQCPGCAPQQFDLSGTAMGAMALPGKAALLRNAGRVNILYQRVPCNYGGVKIVFHVDAGATSFYFAVNIEYENGDGDLGKVELQNGSGPFVPMQEVFGATWKLNSGSQLIGPLSIRLTTLSGKSLTANNVIPVGWKPNQFYRAQVNF